MDNKLLRSGGEFVKLNSYDLINEVFHCENEIKIRKLDVATGLATANYLIQRINNIEGKYVVILLDETGNMDGNNLDLVIDSIKKLESEKRLILAAFTQPKIGEFEIIEH